MKKVLKVGIVGSRTLNPANLEDHLPQGTTAIISGGAKGVDRAAATLARRLNLELVEFLPDYRRYGRGAPHRRNAQIVEAADLILAFWDGKSRGTQSTINLARKAGKECQIILNA